MMEQLALDGTSTLLGLTERQQFVLERIEAVEGGLAVDEVGSLLHERSGKHSAGLRCDYCGSDGRSVLAALRRKGLLVRRRKGLWQSKRPLGGRGQDGIAQDPVEADAAYDPGLLASPLPPSGSSVGMREWHDWVVSLPK
jgi:hypothetical protein